MSSLIYLLSPTAKEGLNHLPVLTFKTLVSTINFDFINILLFTSKQAVITTNSISDEWKQFPCIAIGKSTTKTIEDLGGKVIYMPKSNYGEDIAKDLLTYFYDKRIFYLRPKKTAFDINVYIEEHKSNNGHEEVLFFEEIIYETDCLSYKRDQKPIENAIIIFTSPSSIKCFFKSFDWNESYTAIIIGKTTKKYLPKNCSYLVADEPSIDACIAKALHLEEERYLL
ncbi:MAG: Unknown protein [uncultured Sulfurovum sp.]|uniref:Tetrapyrrole biosynthesis uroporphyrinogen III synthase domain-containing protein n=1 Tax=uncultured Sulfurovum sp. TaxID=269237 RepID=A0A6S6S875_9BACT|nr:MAG: Unknown protein [uncultured Sulfurovum sp.]